VIYRYNTLSILHLSTPYNSFDPDLSTTQQLWHQIRGSGSLSAVEYQYQQQHSASSVNAKMISKTLNPPHRLEREPQLTANLALYAPRTFPEIVSLSFPTPKTAKRNTPPTSASSASESISVSRLRLKATRTSAVRNAQSRSKSRTSESSRQMRLIRSMLHQTFDHLEVD
jgi:hypothetical protein